MRARANDLFELIKSLSVQEHRYFSKYLGEQRLKYSDELDKMFGLIREQEVYEEKAIKEALKGTYIIKFFPQYKNQLNDLVIKSLINYHKENSVEAEIHHLLQVEAIFRQRGLSEQCAKILSQAREKSFKYEHHLLELEVLKRQIALLGDLFPKDFSDQLNKLISEKNVTFLKLQNESEYRDISQKLFFLVRKMNNLRDEDTVKELDELIKEPLLQNENDAFNFWSKLMFNYTHAQYHKLKKDHIKSIKYRKRIVELWQLYPHKIQENPRYYLGALFSLIGSLHNVRNYNESEIWLKEVKKISVKSETENAKIFEQAKHNELLILINTDRFEEALELVPEIDDGLNKFKSLIQNSFRLALYYNIYLTYFIVDDHTSALKWVNKIIDIDKTEERQDIQDFSKIFRLIVFYCKGKYDLIESQLRATKRILQKNNRLYDLETTIIKYLPKLIETSHNQKEQKNVLTEFKAELDEISIDNKGVLGMQETGLWVESKLRNITFRELLRELIETSSDKK